MTSTTLKLAAVQPPHRRPARYSYRECIDQQIPSLQLHDMERPQPEEGTVSIDSTGTFEFRGGEWRPYRKAR